MPTANRLHLAAGALLVGSATAAASAVPILWVCDGAGRIGRIDVETGGVLSIVETGIGLTDIAFSPEGDLYGIDFSSLHAIDPDTGASSNVGGHGIGLGNALAFGFDGTLYAAGAGGGGLHALDRATGASRLIGDMGFASAGDLTFNGDGFYMSSSGGDLVSIDPFTAEAEAIGPLGLANPWGLATAENGITYAVAGTAIHAVDLETGATTFLSDFGGQGIGAATGSSFVAIPGPGAPACLALAAGLGGVGRRRRG